MEMSKTSINGGKTITHNNNDVNRNKKQEGKKQLKLKILGRYFDER